MTFQTSDIERANQLNPIAGLYERFGCGKLRRDGPRLVGPCPFHGGVSFKIHPNGKAYCYGCGWHGDAVDFYREHTGLGVKEAVADMLGTPTTESTFKFTPRDTRAEEQEAKRKRLRVQQIWQEATPC